MGSMAGRGSWLAGAGILAGVLVTGCITVGPDYVPPRTSLPERYAEEAPPAEGAGVPARPPSLEEWWTVFDDPGLDRVVREARERNHDLRIAVARVREARAMLRAAIGERQPAAAAKASASREDSGDGPAENSFSLGADVTWEIDLFGKIRRSVEAAEASLQVTEADRQGVLLAVTAEAARLYLAGWTADRQLRRAREAIAIQRDALELNRARRRHGLVSDLEVAQSERVLASSLATLPKLRAHIARNRHALAVLLGETPSEFRLEFPDRPVPVPDLDPDAGVPADLLRRRPDVIAAERELAARTAKVGVALADLYPSLSLRGFIGASSAQVGDLLDADSFSWKVEAPLRWRIFEGGQIRARVEGERARVEQALATWEKTVLVAIREVEDALVTWRESRNRAKAMAHAEKIAARTLHLSRVLYRDGLSDYLATLDAEQASFRAVIDSAGARGDAAAALVDLYRALGGGWPAPAAGEENEQ